MNYARDHDHNRCNVVHLGGGLTAIASHCATAYRTAACGERPVIDARACPQGPAYQPTSRAFPLTEQVGPSALSRGSKKRQGRSLRPGHSDNRREHRPLVQKQLNHARQETRPDNC